MSRYDFPGAGPISDEVRNDMAADVASLERRLGDLAAGVADLKTARALLESWVTVASKMTEVVSFALASRAAPGSTRANSRERAVGVRSTMLNALRARTSGFGGDALLDFLAKGMFVEG